MRLARCATPFTLSGTLSGRIPPKGKAMSNSIPVAQHAPAFVLEDEILVPQVAAAVHTQELMIVRMIGVGIAREFMTPRCAAVVKIVRDSFARIGLNSNYRSGEIWGYLRQPYEPFTTCYVEGAARFEDGTLTIELTPRTGFPFWVDCIAFLLLPLFLVLIPAGIAAYLLTRKAATRSLENAFEESRQRLSKE